MNKVFKILAMVLLFCGCDNKNYSELVIETDNDKVVYDVEIASSIAELQTGLMNRDSLPKSNGMLFDLSPFMDSQETSMWMKDTKIPLDMIFISQEGLIFWIKENAQPYSEEEIKTPFPAYAALEINAGEVAKHNIKVGHRVRHFIFKEQEETSAIETGITLIPENIDISYFSDGSASNTENVEQSDDSSINSNNDVTEESK